MVAIYEIKNGTTPHPDTLHVSQKGERQPVQTVVVTQDTGTKKPVSVVSVDL